MMFNRWDNRIQPKRFLLIPIPKNPYSRIGPEKWQDWYRQVQRTIAIARELKSKSGAVEIIILSKFQPKGKSSEIEMYTRVFHELAPDLKVTSYRETNDILGQIEKSFKLKKEVGARLIFVTAWMQYLRVLYLARGREAEHHGVFGIPQPVFAFIDPFCIIFQPLIDFLGLSKFFQRVIVRQREKGKILF